MLLEGWSLAVLTESSHGSTCPNMHSWSLASQRCTGWLQKSCSMLRRDGLTEPVFHRSKSIEAGVNMCMLQA